MGLLSSGINRKTSCEVHDISIDAFLSSFSLSLSPLSDVVTCMALDRVGTGEHLITGSRDTTCVVWRFGSNVSLTSTH